jgi:hypothetical protein
MHCDAAFLTAFAGSVPRMRELIDGKYEGHLEGHKKADLIHEVFGGVSPRSLAFLTHAVHDMRGRDQPGSDPSDPDSDADDAASRSIIAYTLQAISISIHSNVADQVFAYAATIRESRDLPRQRMDARGGF